LVNNALLFTISITLAWLKTLTNLSNFALTDFINLFL
jgi:hypothetical protein